MIYRKSKLNNIFCIRKPDLNKFISKDSNTTSLNEKNCFSKISNIFNSVYEDYFPKILSNNSIDVFIKEIYDKSMIIINNNYTDNELQIPSMKDIIEKIKKDNNDKINQIHSFLEKSLNQIIISKKYNYVNHFRKHCDKTEDISYHLCNKGKFGIFIQIESENNEQDISYIICQNCHYCYKSNFIKMYCKFCKKAYYSEILKDEENINCLPATWDKYHCGIRKKEIMKCLKCKEILYLNLTTNRVICLNKNCNFSSKPEHIIWGCHLCGAEFKSGAKIHNPLEFIILTKIVNKAMLYKIKAIPTSLPCCNGIINDKIIFCHNKICNGQLYLFNLEGRDFVVCEKCQALNKFNHFTWLCPLCSQNFILSDKNLSKIKKHNNNYSNSLESIEYKNNIKLIREKKLSNEINNNSFISISKNLDISSSPMDKNLFGFGFYKRKFEANEYAKGKSKNKRNKSETNIKDDSNEKEKENNNRNYKSIDHIQEDRRHIIRKKRTLQEILNSRKETPSFGKKKKEKSSEKDEDIIGGINCKRKIFSQSIDNCYGDKKQNNKNNLDSEMDNKNIEKFQKKNRLIYKRMITELKENNENPNIRNEINKVKINKYINAIKKNHNASKSIDIKENNNNFNNYYNINNINNINIINSIEIKKDEKEEKSNYDLKEGQNINPKNKNIYISTSRNIENSSKCNCFIKSSINKLVSNDKYLNKNKLSSIKGQREYKKYIDNENEPNNSLNKTAENFYKKKISSVSIEPINNYIKSKRGNYKQNKIEPLYHGNSKVNSTEISKGKIIINEAEKSNNNKYINKLKWKGRKFNDYANDKTCGEKNKIDNNIIKNDIINEEKINNELISKEKIVGLINHCSIPIFDDKDYNYIKLIGEGSYGKIYLVEDKITKEEYALKKVLCADYKDLLKFKKEFELIYSLQNPNILHIYKLQLKNLDLTTSCLYVLMERAQSDWNIEIKRRKIAKKFYKEYEIISILKQLSQGLFFLQKNKIAHRDIKPQNILIFPNNIYKIADMGEAKEIDKNKMQMATLRGSELFMSPLLYEGLKYNKKNIRHNPYKSDMFSLGLCFLYAICLNLKVLEYIREMTNMNNIKNILEKFLDTNKYSDKLIKIVYKMIDLDENKRFDFNELENELTQF